MFSTITNLEIKSLGIKSLQKSLKDNKNRHGNLGAGKSD